MNYKSEHLLDENNDKITKWGISIVIMSIIGQYFPLSCYNTINRSLHTLGGVSSYLVQIAKFKNEKMRL